jgi:hypothetical protein
VSRTQPSSALSALALLLAAALGVALPGGSAAAATPRGASATTTHTVVVGLSGVPARVALNRRVPVTGVVTDVTAGRPLADAPVVLQVQSARGWATTPGTAAVTDAHGRFVLPAPTFYYGRHVFRALVAARSVAAGTVTAAAGSPARAVTVPLPYRPAGRASAGRVEPTRFDPCAPIPYRINYAGAPRRARALVAAALGRARAATGLTFTYAGSYAGVPFSRQSNGGLPSTGIGFAWTTAGQVRGLAGSAIGLGGGGWSAGARRTSSGVVIDRAFRYRSGWTGTNSIGGLLLHEIGHALGLEHVNDRTQQMYPRDIGAPNGNYNRGDLTALRKVGLDAGCL